MNRQQKIAWFQLVIIIIAMIASAGNSLLYMHRYGYVFSKAWWFGSAWPTGFCVLGVVLSPLFFRKKKGRMNFDERDLMIDRQASRFGSGAALFFLIASCSTIWIAVGIDKAIPAYWLGRVILGGWLTAAVAHAITTIVGYGMRYSDGEK